MDYENISDAELKIRLLYLMEKASGINYVLGWLKQSYIYPTLPEIERAVAIKEIKRYELEESLNTTETEF